MRRVVATVAFGAIEYLQAAEIMFRSLRVAGWEGECVCLSDQFYPFARELDVSTQKIPAVRNVKAAAASTLVSKPYDVLLLADSDMVWQRDPSSLLDQYEKGPRVACGTTAYPLHNFPYNLKHFSEADKAAIPPDQGSLNTGVMIFPGALAGAFCGRWSFAHAKLAAGMPLTDGIQTLGDQPVLEWLVHRRELMVERLFPGVMAFPAFLAGPPSRDAYVLHYTGFAYHEAGKLKQLDAMRAAQRRLQEEAAHEAV